jgi:hypothetical protein
VIAGATRPGQVRANAAGPRWQPTGTDLEALSAVLGAAQPEPERGAPGPSRSAARPPWRRPPAAYQ